MDGHDGMMMLQRWCSVLVEMGMKVVVRYWWFEGVMVDRCDAWFRERGDGDQKLGMGDVGSVCLVRPERRKSTNEK